MSKCIKKISEKCPECNGTGLVRGYHRDSDKIKDIRCSWCNGTGKYDHDEGEHDFQYVSEYWMKCTKCGATTNGSTSYD